MKKLALLIMLGILIVTAGAAWGRKGHPPDDGISADAERSFGEIMALWHEKNFDGLYDRTLSSGKLSRKSFAGKLAKARHRPACCWQMVQDVRVTVKSADSVVVRAKIGLEGPGDIQYRNGTFKMRRVGGVWRVSRADLISLAGTGKKKRYTDKEQE